MAPDLLADLVEFARVETESGDVEPWAAVIGAVAGQLGPEPAAQLLTLYNCYDDLGSAWRLLQRWPDPRIPLTGAARAAATVQPISPERRNLYGGRILRRCDAYTSYLDGRTALEWLRGGLPAADPAANFLPMQAHLRQIWGVGRLAAFEWSEFWAKVSGVSVEAPDAHLWESSGPRESLQHLYSNTSPDAGWLDSTAAACKATLAAAGVVLSWWDFETVICDFNVMRKGRYYPGQHIAMIRAEIGSLDEPGRGLLAAALESVVPAPWSDIPPGIDRTLRPLYRDTGRIPLPPAVTRSHHAT